MTAIGPEESATTMRAIRLRAPGGPEGLALEQIDTPALQEGAALVRVHAAAITRDELSWQEVRFPAIPSFELSGVVAAIAPGVDLVSVGDAVFALTPFDRDGAAADYAVADANLLIAKPARLDDVASAAIPLAALSAWQGLFVHGRLKKGERVLILGAGGGVGHLAVQLARSRGAHVTGTASKSSAEIARAAGVDELRDLADTSLEPVDLVFDTVGGDLLARSPKLLRRGGRIVSIAEDPPEGMDATYFVVETDRGQLEEIARMTDDGALRPSIDSVFALEDATAAFERSLVAGKRGKVVMKVLG